MINYNETYNYAGTHHAHTLRDNDGNALLSVVFSQAVSPDVAEAKFKSLLWEGERGVHFYSSRCERELASVPSYEE